MRAQDYPTYRAYCEARREAGLQVLPSLLWKALKTGNHDLVTRKNVTPANLGGH